MDGINRALDNNILNSLNKVIRTFESISDSDVPCIFISYQRADQEYAKKIADYITDKQLDVYFDINDKDLKQANQKNDPKKVTEAITKGLNQSKYMIVIVSPNTYNSPWVPFEIGYAFDKKGDRMKILRHKGISKSAMPDYMKVKHILQGTISLNHFLASIRKENKIYESLLEKGEQIRAFSAHQTNPLNAYLDNE